NRNARIWGLKFQIITVQSNDPDANCRMLGLYERHSTPDLWPRKVRCSDGSMGKQSLEAASVPLHLSSLYQQGFVTYSEPLILNDNLTNHGINSAHSNDRHLGSSPSIQKIFYR
ncbi:hypothetical protein DYB28_015661, partial [Aphanomyces astaci]